MSQAKWSGPDEAWPTHPRPLANRALKRARRAGWFLRKSSGKAHVWGLITCGDPGLAPEQRCTTSVMSTAGPADGSATARVIEDLVGKCPHKRADPAPDLREQARELAESAAKCLQAAQSLFEAGQHRDLVEDYLRQALDDATEADQLVERAVREESAANEADAAAEAAASDTGLTVNSGTRNLAIAARTRAAKAKQLVSGDSDREARKLRSRCDEIRHQAQRLLGCL